MAGYVIVNLEVTNAEVYAEFREKVADSLAAHGGRYLARGGPAEAVEGDWAPERLIVMEFDSVAQAKTWLDSPEYTELREIRVRSATASVIVVEGV